MGEAKPASLRVDFDRRLKLEIHGSQISSDAERLARDPVMRAIVDRGSLGFVRRQCRLDPNGRRHGQESDGRGVP